MAPNTQIENIYFQLYIGATTEINDKYSPVTSISVPLQMVATAALGLPYTEIKPRIGYHDLPKQDYGGKYVCISEFGSSEDKSWKCENGWQDVVDFLIQKIYEFDIAHFLTIEITESEGVDNLEELISFIKIIKNLGVKIAIDDFGTGYSNFSYLVKLQAVLS